MHDVCGCVRRQIFDVPLPFVSILKQLEWGRGQPDRLEHNMPVLAHTEDAMSLAAEVKGLPWLSA